MLDLTEDETGALASLLSRTIDGDRYPLSPRIQMLKAILAKIRPGPLRKPLPPLKRYEPPTRHGGQETWQTAVVLQTASGALASFGSSEVPR